MPADPPRADRSDDRTRTDPPTASEAEAWGYDDYLRELDRLAAEREAANRKERDSRSLSFVALAVAIAALGISLAALVFAALKT